MKETQESISKLYAVATKINAEVEENRLLVGGSCFGGIYQGKFWFRNWWKTHYPISEKELIERINAIK
jgi:hypothetical protein